MEKNKVIVIGHNLKDKEAIYTYLASKEAEVIVVDSIEEAKNLLGDTNYPETEPPKPFVITEPKIYERTFEDYHSGQEKRRERRSKKRRGSGWRYVFGLPCMAYRVTTTAFGKLKYTACYLLGGLISRGIK